MAADITAQVRAAVARRAEHRCEYCLINERDVGFPHQIDHIVSRKHGGSSDADNLAYACVICNRNKGSDVASIDTHTGEPTRLFHPRRDRWDDHFYLAGEVIESRSEIGAVTCG